MTFFFFLPSILLSGFMFPFRGMPDWAQWLGEMLPLTHFLRIVRGILLKGNGVGRNRARAVADRRVPGRRRGARAAPLPPDARSRPPAAYASARPVNPSSTRSGAVSGYCEPATGSSQVCSSISRPLSTLCRT